VNWKPVDGGAGLGSSLLGGVVAWGWSAVNWTPAEG
jgi:hypothetical protein